jgi:hypothetical protein
VVGFCLLLPRFWNKYRIGIVENSMLSCAKNSQEISMCYLKVTKGVYYHKLQVESLVQIIFSNSQNSSILLHELIRTSLTLQS